MWQAVIKKLKVELPADYYDYARHYGSGGFAQKEGDCTYLYNPLSRYYLRTVKDTAEMYREIRREEGREEFKYPVFPPRPGCCRWAATATATASST